MAHMSWTRTTYSKEQRDVGRCIDEAVTDEWAARSGVCGMALRLFYGCRRPRTRYGNRILIGCSSAVLIQSPMAIVLLSAASRRMSVCVLVCPHTKLKKLPESWYSLVLWWTLMLVTFDLDLWPWELIDHCANTAYVHHHYGLIYYFYKYQTNLQPAKVVQLLGTSSAALPHRGFGTSVSHIPYSFNPQMCKPLTEVTTWNISRDGSIGLLPLFQLT